MVLVGVKACRFSGGQPSLAQQCCRAGPRPVGSAWERASCPQVVERLSWTVVRSVPSHCLSPENVRSLRHPHRPDCSGPVPRAGTGASPLPTTVAWETRLGGLEEGGADTPRVCHLFSGENVCINFITQTLRQKWMFMLSFSVYHNPLFYSSFLCLSLLSSSWIISVLRTEALSPVAVLLGCSGPPALYKAHCVCSAHDRTYSVPAPASWGLVLLLPVGANKVLLEYKPWLLACFVCGGFYTVMTELSQCDRASVHKSSHTDHPALWLISAVHAHAD